MLEDNGKKGCCKTWMLCIAVGAGCLRRHTFLASARKVCKRSSLKEENPFEWVFSLKNLSFLNDQRGSKKVRKAFLHTPPKDAGREAPLETRSFWRGACRGHLRSRKAERHSSAALAVHGAWSFVVSPVRGREALAQDDSLCARQTGFAGRAALRRVGGST